MAKQTELTAEGLAQFLEKEAQKLVAIAAHVKADWGRHGITSDLAHRSYIATDISFVSHSLREIAKALLEYKA